MCLSVHRIQTQNRPKNFGTILDLCVSSLRREHANLLCIFYFLANARRRKWGENYCIYTPCVRLTMHIISSLILRNVGTTTVPHIKHMQNGRPGVGRLLSSVWPAEASAHSASLSQRSSRQLPYGSYLFLRRKR
jgi:hypothetical protein